MRIFFLMLGLILSSFIIQAQCIEGKVLDTSGNPIPYATIYASSISKGTTSNLEGIYKLELPKGKHQLTVRYLGYKTKDVEVVCIDSLQYLDIILDEQLYKIPEVRILASGEDPAYSIMRKAIAMSYYYLNQVEEYKCRIYLKGTGVVAKIPRLLKKTLKKEGVEEGKPMVTENITDLHFKLPDVVEENIISMRSTMDGDDMSPNGYITLSLYNDIDGVISPLSRDAFTYYKFQLDASFYDQDYLVHKIKIIPRREGYDLYSGYIYLVEGFWHLHSAELQLEQKMFKIKINQVYSPVGKNVWMPVSHNFDIDAGIMGVEFSYKYIASVSNYKIELNSKLDHSVYKNLLADSKEYVQEVNEVSKQQQSEIQKLIQKEDITKKESRKLKKLVRENVAESIPKKDLELTDQNIIEDSAMLRSVSYWDSIRPIPLTMKELDEYKVKDSIQFKIETDSTFKDSLERDKYKFKWRKLLTGGDFNFNDEHTFRFGGIVDLGHINFNTVEGLNIGTEFSYRYSNDKGKFFRVNQTSEYAFSCERMTSYLSAYYRYNGLKRASFRVSGGRKISDFDAETGISEYLNLITTLFLKENYLKLYQKDYIKLSHSFDIVNGLNLFTGFEYAQRKELINHSDFYVSNPLDNNFTSNIPPVNNVNQALVGDHNASIFSLGISYTPEYFYRMNDGVKFNSHSRFPTFKLNYTKGIKSLFASDVDFDHLEFSISQHESVRRIGNVYYRATAGSFLNDNSMYFADYKHFAANAPFVIGTSEGSAFRLIDYYDYSTSKNYFEGHIRLDNDRILLKRLPVLNRTLMRESLYFNYLATEGNYPYYEFGYGLNQIFLMFNVEIFAGFKGLSHEYTGIKIGIPFVSKNGTSVFIGG
ncbi:MAG: carboxypeptidase-like regulatory domain-containing protein [Bacteroidales bacterium]|nr:carboxypeptidase-like regulatory domain-containing protein [Bacteroidales bacterium]